MNEVTQKFVDLCDALSNAGELDGGRQPNALHLFSLHEARAPARRSRFARSLPPRAKVLIPILEYELECHLRRTQFSNRRKSTKNPDGLRGERRVARARAARGFTFALRLRPADCELSRDTVAREADGFRGGR